VRAADRQADPVAPACRVVLSIPVAVSRYAAGSPDDVADAARATLRGLDDALRSTTTAWMLQRCARAPEQYLAGDMFVYASLPDRFVSAGDPYPRDEVVVIRAFLAELLARRVVIDIDNAMLFVHTDGADGVTAIGIPADPARDVLLGTVPFAWS
jgi:hypothetical protein